MYVLDPLDDGVVQLGMIFAVRRVMVVIMVRMIVMIMMKITIPV